MIGDEPLAELARRPLPRFPSWWAALGPGFVWMALAQGSGALVWWPYLVAKYGLTFLWLLIPACLLPYPLTIEIGRYTLLTGESIFPGFFRVSPWLGGLLWILMTVSFVWFGAFASAGGSALAALTGFPAGFGMRGRTLFWAYATIAIVVVAIALSGVVYRTIERGVKAVALVTVGVLVWACTQPEVTAVLPTFLSALAGSPGPSERAWDVLDLPKLVTAVALTGLSGFWILLYASWLRAKGSGMGAYSAPLTGLRRGSWKGAAPPSSAGHLIDDSEASATEWRHWRRFLTADALVGILGNLVTTLLTCLLAYALHYPRGILPEPYDLAAVEAAFFAVSWGRIGRVLFLGLTAAFLTDTWLVSADGVSRMQAELIYARFPAARRLPQQQWYYVVLATLTMLTCVTTLIEAPLPLLRLSAAIGFAATVLFPPALYVLNYRRLKPAVPPWARPHRLEALLLAVSFVVYALLAGAYVWATYS